MFRSRIGIRHGIGQLGRVLNSGREEGSHWNLLNGKIEMYSYYTNTRVSYALTSATAAMKRTSRRHTPNIRRVFRHSMPPYRNSSRPKGCAIVDAEKQYFQIDQFSIDSLKLIK